MAQLPADIRDRLADEYPGETYYEAARLVESLGLAPRVLRSIVHLAGGRFADLERFARRAEQDWREVVFWAEYDDPDAEEPKRVRSMEEPFPRG